MAGKKEKEACPCCGGAEKSGGSGPSCGCGEAAAGGCSCCEGGAKETLCPVETTISLIGGKYKALIVWRLMDGPMRFSQLSRAVAGATPRMLTRQLRELEADGLVLRRAFAEVPVRVEYSLTPTGKTIYPILAAMYRWGSGYLKAQGKAAGCSMRPPEDMDPLCPDPEKLSRNSRMGGTKGRSVRPRSGRTHK